MILFLLRRLAIGLVVIFLVSTAVFLVTRVVTSPEKAYLPIDASVEQREAVRADLGLDKPIGEQYGTFLGDLARGDLGDSYWQPGKSTLTLVLDRLPSTLLLNSVAIVLALLIAVPLGIIAALKAGSAVDRVATTVSLLGLSAPQFWLGFLLILLFGVNLQWFPTSGADRPASIVLPALALALPTAGKIAQMMRSTMIDELGRPYMLTAESKGMGQTYRVVRHALRNCTVPVLTQGAFEYARMLAGFTVVVETVFAWPGVGSMTVNALEQQDLMLLQAIVIVIATLIVLVNVVTDILYSVVDPRIEVA
jgi:peptide/nickel transport system permease protein